MRMSENESKRLTDETVKWVSAMSGEGKTDFIDLIFDQYKHSKRHLYPKREVRKFYDLLSQLVKKFGH